MDMQIFSQNWLMNFYLILLRVTGIIVFSPLLGKRNIPVTLKIGLSMLISYIISGIYSPLLQHNNYTDSMLLEYVLLCIKELLVGIIMGYILLVFFNSISIAGRIIDVQIGFGMAQIFNPAEFTHESVLGNLINYCFYLYFITFGGLHVLLRLLYLTFEKIPVGRVIINAEIIYGIIEAFSKAFVMGVCISLPIIAIELFIEAAMGVLIRAVPQLNIFIVGIPIKIFIGLLLLGLLIYPFSKFSEEIISHIYNSMDNIFTGLVVAK